MSSSSEESDDLERVFELFDEQPGEEGSSTPIAHWKPTPHGNSGAIALELPNDVPELVAGSWKLYS
jgi:hypothetical protein